jgi:hypothetical protein
VPRSLREDFAAGRITLEQIRARTPAPSRPTYTAKGQETATAFRMWSPEDNPRLSCKPTSIVFDWTFDWPINRVTQTTVDGEKVIDIDYGLFSASRRVHLGNGRTPANLAPSNSGHSIGRWDGDTLVVDTVGFAEGVLVPPTRNSPQLHVVERFTLDPKTFALKREYTAGGSGSTSRRRTRARTPCAVGGPVREAAVLGAHVRVHAAGQLKPRGSSSVILIVGNVISEAPEFLTLTAYPWDVFSRRFLGLCELSPSQSSPSSPPAASRASKSAPPHRKRSSTATARTATTTPSAPES